MLVVIRADCSLQIGTGHVMRCAALAMRLRRYQAKVHLLCCGLSSLLKSWLEINSILVHILEPAVACDWNLDAYHTINLCRSLGNIDLLVVDNYQLDFKWELSLRPYVRRILVIDDLANRKHDCDFLLDQNLRRNSETRYEPYLPLSAKTFLGPCFALLRPEFDAPGLIRSRDGKLKRLLIFFGGTDPGNQSLKVIKALHLLDLNDIFVTLILGDSHCDPPSVYSCATGMTNIEIIRFSSKMSLLISHADLAIGTCGVAAWERCLLGLPSINVITAENQREDAEILHEFGAIFNLGDSDNVHANHIADAVLALRNDQSRLASMSIKAQSIMSNCKESFYELEKALLG